MAFRNMGTALHTPTITAGAYAEKEVVGSLLTLAGNPVRKKAGAGALMSIVLHDQSEQIGTHGLLLTFFSDNPSGSTFTDNAAVTIVDADLPKVIIEQPMTEEFGARIIPSAGSVVVALHQIEIPYFCLDEDLYALISTLEGSTPTFASTTALSARFMFERYD